jgi:hypothetical protein
MKPQAPPVRAGGGPRRRLGIGIAAMVAAAAVATIGFLGVRVADDRHRIDDLAGRNPAQVLRRSADAALADPQARKVELASSDGSRRSQAVVLPDGTGYLVAGNLPVLPRERTYQLWAVAGSTRISVGVLGADPPQVVPFKMDPQSSILAVTEEAAGGVETTRKDPVVAGRLS